MINRLLVFTIAFGLVDHWGTVGLAQETALRELPSGKPNDPPEGSGQGEGLDVPQEILRDPLFQRIRNEVTQSIQLDRLRSIVEGQSSLPVQEEFSHWKERELWLKAARLMLKSRLGDNKKETQLSLKTREIAFLLRTLASSPESKWRKLIQPYSQCDIDGPLKSKAPIAEVLRDYSKSENRSVLDESGWQAIEIVLKSSRSLESHFDNSENADKQMHMRETANVLRTFVSEIIVLGTRQE